MSKVAYITSGKIGIHRFTYNELVELKKNEIDFALCLTQLNQGPWMPLSAWEVYVASRFKSFITFAKLLLSRPKSCFALFKEAINENVVPYFFISLSFYGEIGKQKKITSLHCQMGDKKLYIGYFLKKLMEKPLTVTIHAHELYQKEVYWNNSQARTLFSKCDKIITISDFNSNVIRESLADNPDLVSVMRLFPSIDYQYKVLNKTKILIVANWVEKKGYNILFEAISKIYRDDFVIWVVGGKGRFKNTIDLTNIIKTYSIENKVALLGSQGGIVLDIIYYACDIFCLPSYTELHQNGIPSEREGIPVSLMEAMAWGKPVISTRHAGIPELVDEILIEEKNVNQLKEAIEFLLDHPEKWKVMGERNKRIIADRYSQENVKILVDVFKQWQ